MIPRTAAATLAVATALLAGCGETSREDYITELTRDGEVSDEIASCMYGEIAADQNVLDDIDDNGADAVSDESVDVLAVAFAKCYIELSPEGDGQGDDGEGDNSEGDSDPDAAG